MSSNETRHSDQLWHPRYWLVWLAVALLYLFSLLPMGFKHSFGSMLGRCLYRVMKSRADVTRKNLRACFPDWSSADIENVARQTFVEVAKSFMDSLHLWSHPYTDATGKTEFVGLDHLREAESKGAGVLFIGGHYNLIDLGFLLVNSNASNPGYMYRANDNPVLNKVIERGRLRHGKASAFTKFQGREMVEFLKSGGQVAYACDQDFNHKTKYFVPFFGMDAPCIDTPTSIVRESGASVIFVSYYRTPGGYRVEYSPIQTDFGLDAEADARAWTGFIENTVRDNPDQYYWLHKRFKTRPPGMAKLY